MKSLNAISRWLRTPARSTAPAGAERTLQQVRVAMLAALERHGLLPQWRALAERVTYAGELESLWYLRQDLLTALMNACGEARARQELQPINALFGRSEAFRPRLRARMRAS